MLLHKRLQPCSYVFNNHICWFKQILHFRPFNKSKSLRCSTSSMAAMLIRLWYWLWIFVAFSTCINSFGIRQLISRGDEDNKRSEEEFRLLKRDSVIDRQQRLLVEQNQPNETVSGWDWAPHILRYISKHYPPLFAKNETNATTRAKHKNNEGIRLFGYDNCDKEQQDIINETWDDFTVSLGLGEIKAINWTSRAAVDFFGASIPKGKRDVIQGVFDNLRMTKKWIWKNRTAIDGGNIGRGMWLEVQCTGTGSDNSTDPQNACADRSQNPRPNSCVRPVDIPIDKETLIEGFAQNPSLGHNRTYNRITFCNRFFNRKEGQTNVTLRQLAEKDEEKRLNLELWDNRATTMIHLLTHLTSIVSSDFAIDDILVMTNQPRDGRQELREWAYGPFWTKILSRTDGLYSQFNADNYAFYALAVWAEKRLEKKYGEYPSLPVADDDIYPIGNPKSGDSNEIGTDDISKNDDEDEPKRLRLFRRDNEEDEFGMAIHDELSGCSDRLDSELEVLKGGPPPTCSDIGVDVQAELFSGTMSNVYKKFCQFVEGASLGVYWIVNQHGERVEFPDYLTEKGGIQPKIQKRGSVEDRNANLLFQLRWKPGEKVYKPSECSWDCASAFRSFSTSCATFSYDIGGAITNGLMSDEGAIQAGCGAYTYSIGGAEMLPPPPTNEYPGAETGPSAMIKSFIHSTQVFPLRCLKRQDPEKNWKEKNPYDNGNLFKTDIVGHRADLFCNLLDAEEVFLGPNLPSQAKYFRMLPDETLHHQIEVGFRVEWVDNCVSEFQLVKVKDFYGCRIFFRLNHQNCNGIVDDDINLPKSLWAGRTDGEKDDDQIHHGLGGEFQIGCIKFRTSVRGAWEDPEINPYGPDYDDNANDGITRVRPKIWR